jgi:hypothetical protein
MPDCKARLDHPAATMRVSYRSRDLFYEALYEIPPVFQNAFVKLDFKIRFRIDFERFRFLHGVLRYRNAGMVAKYFAIRAMASFKFS